MTDPNKKVVLTKPPVVQAASDSAKKTIAENPEIPSSAILWVFATAGLCVVFRWSTNTYTALMWALACLMTGYGTGFLFGIPRVAPTVSSSAGPGDPSRPQIRADLLVNTNLEQISDWLTKIIVGLGLTNLQRLPHFLWQASGFLAGSLKQPVATSQPFAMALIVYFVILGFLAGYITTRLYLSAEIDKADRKLNGKEETVASAHIIHEDGSQDLLQSKETHIPGPKKTETS